MIDQAILAGIFSSDESQKKDDSSRSIIKSENTEKTGRLLSHYVKYLFTKDDNSSNINEIISSYIPEIEAYERLDKMYDFCISLDWGRDFGIDNQQRVTEIITQLVNQDHFKIWKNTKTMEIWEHGVQHSFGAIIFLTDRYIRRFKEHGIVENYYAVIRKHIPLNRTIIVFLEKRVVLKAEKYLAVLNLLPMEVTCLDLSDCVTITSKNQIVALQQLIAQQLLLNDYSVTKLKTMLEVTLNKEYFYAIEIGDLSTLQTLLSTQGDDINATKRKYSIQNTKDIFHRTGLLVAIACNQLEVIKYFVETILQDVTFNNKENVLLPSFVKNEPQQQQQKQFLQAVDKEGNNLLHLACEVNNIEGLHYLSTHIKIQQELPYNQFNNAGYTPLHLAAKKGYAALVKYLITLPMVDLHASTLDGDTALEITSNEEIATVLRTLQSEQQMFFQFIQQKQINEMTALLLSLEQNDPNRIKHLINCRNEDGRSGIFYAILNGHIEMMQLLLSNGADVINVKDNWLDIPLTIAASYGTVEIMKLLLTTDIQKECVHVQNTYGNTALFNAVQFENRHTAAILLAHGANPNIPGLSYVSSVSLRPIEVALTLKNYDIINLLLETGEVFVTPEITTLIVSQLPNICVPVKALQAENHLLWFQLITLDIYDVQYASLFSLEIKEYYLSFLTKIVKENLPLVYVKDKYARMAHVIATDTNKAIINSLILWHGRYRPMTTKPEHISSTCYVMKAYDENTLDGNGNPIQVALKLIRYKKHFLQEISIRQTFSFSEQYVIPVLMTIPTLLTSENDENDISTWPEDTMKITGSEECDSSFGKQLELSKEIIEKLYCIVMPLGERNLFVAMKQEQFTGGKNYDLVRLILKQIVYSIQHIHSLGIIHADLKPLNIVRIQNIWKLIDFDASCQMNQDHIGKKYSSGYIPPEAIFYNPIKQTYHIKTPPSQNHKKKSGGSDENDEENCCLLAENSFDIWSLGCILYQLCSIDMQSLFQVNQDDNIPFDNTVNVNLNNLKSSSLISSSASLQQHQHHHRDTLSTLYHWTDELKEWKLTSQILDPFARNLLSLLLMKDPQKRPSIERILAHPFVSGITPKTFRYDQNIPAKYDYFISYRVASDYEIAKRLYEYLEGLHFRVWWDKTCLPIGLDWQVGFCEGLLNSQHYLCILSKPGISSFAQFQETSPCDNLLLEIRLALELRTMGYLTHIIPIFVNEYQPRIEGFLPYEMSSCWPSNAPQIVVQSIEKQLQNALTQLGLGVSFYLPTDPKITVSGLLSQLQKCQGYFFQGTFEQALEKLGTELVKIQKDEETTGSNTNKEEKAEENLNMIKSGHVNIVRSLQHQASQ